MVKSKIIPVGLYEANCIILWNESNKALIIDPGADADLITEYIEKAKLEPVAVFFTHGHFDHVSGVDGILEKYTLPVYLHGGDKELLFCDLNISQPGYPRIMREDAINYFLDEGDEIPLSTRRATPKAAPVFTLRGTSFSFLATLSFRDPSAVPICQEAHICK